MQKKIPVKDLAIGMFVAELDRPWLESPFLFQGFLIETQDELGKLQECCEWVLVDEQRSASPREASASTTTTTIIRETARKARAARRLEVVRTGFLETRPLYRQTEAGVIKILGDRRLGKLVQAEPIRASVGQLMQNILRNPNAALWMTKARARDEFSAAHAVNVAILSLAFARHLELPEETMEAIGLGAILHDIGLTESSNALVRKRHPLTSDEYAVIKRHPVEGRFLVKPGTALPQLALDIIRWHHERVDGRGYPDGLAGEEIPLPVRIVAVADTYDAMVSDRVYRQGQVASDVITEMHRTAENTFGRDLAEHFIRCIGIYPVGSTVRLNTGAIAIVASSEPEARLTPVVLLLIDDQGRRLAARQLVDLANSEEKFGQRWFIQEMVNPNTFGIDIGALAKEELWAEAP